MMENIYLPEFVTLRDVREETDDTRTFYFDSRLDSEPGQFVEVTLLGYGEAPISICSHREEDLALTIRATGNVTNAIHRLNPGDRVGIRGPFGRGWPVDKVKGRNLLIVAGGIGLAPLRPALREIIKNRDDYGKVVLCYGARNPELIIYKDELAQWMDHMEVKVTVDYCETGMENRCSAWAGDVGVVTTLFDKGDIPIEDNYAFLCGPPIMMKFGIKELLKRGFSLDRMYISLERHMKCGMGMCGHCQIGGKFACKDGPVFNVAETLTWPERPEETEGIL